MGQIVNMVSVLSATTGSAGPIVLGAAANANFVTEVQAGLVDQKPVGIHVQEGADFMLVKGIYTSATRSVTIGKLLMSVIGGVFSTTTPMTLGGAQVVTIVQLGEDFQEFTDVRDTTGTTDTIVNADGGGVVTYNNASAIAVAIGSPSGLNFKKGWHVWIKNIGAGSVAITPTGGATIEFSTLKTNQGFLIYSDGTNFKIFGFRTDAGTIGNALYTAATAGVARTTLGSTTVGDALYTAATASAARTALGSTAVGDALFTAASAGAAATAIGATAVGDALFTAGSALGARAVMQASTTPFAMENGALVVVISGGTLVISIHTLLGSNPSAADPVFVYFRDASSTQGDYVVLTLTAAASVTVPVTQTFGTPSGGAAFRLWVTGWNDGGTFRLGVSCQSQVNASNAAILPLFEHGIGSSLQVVAAGNTLGQIYTNGAAVTSQAYCLLGYLDWGAGITTAGTWGAGPTLIRLFGHGCKKPGDTVQYAMGSVTAAASFTGTSFGVISGGPTVSLAPSAAANIVRVQTTGTTSNSGSNTTMIQLSRGSTLIGVPAGFFPAGGTAATLGSVFAYDQPNVTTSVTYQVQGKVSAATGYYPLGTTGGLSPATGAAIEAIEIMG